MGSFTVDPEAHDTVRGDEGTSPSDLMSDEAREHVAAERGDKPEEDGQSEASSNEGEKPEEKAGDDKPEESGDKAAEAGDDSKDDGDKPESGEEPDLSAYLSEFQETGQLTDDAREAVLADNRVFSEHVPEEMRGQLLDSLMTGASALQELTNLKTQALLLGEENYVDKAQEAWTELSDWAGKALPQADLDAFNAALTGDEATAKQAVLGLKARFDAANGRGGSEPSLTHEGKGAPGAPPIKSRAQLVQLQRDPRYAKDPAYRASVQQRLAHSMETGQYRADG